METMNNLIRIVRQPEHNIFLYQVTIEPPISDAKILRQIVDHPHVQDHLKKAPFLFGDLIYLPTKVPNFRLYPIPHPESKHSSTDPSSYLKVSVTFLEVLPLRNQLVIFNCLFKLISEMLNYTLMKTKYFDENLPINLDDWMLEIWPGLAVDITTIKNENEQQEELLISCDTSDSVLHKTNILDQIRLLSPNDMFQILVQRYIIGIWVTTKYGDKEEAYRIDDINFEASPRSKYEWFDGVGVDGSDKENTFTYFDYYKQYYGIVIKNLDQPLLVHKKVSLKTNMVSAIL